MSGVFISYRREDAAASAGRLFDHLCARLGRDEVFMDVDGIEIGADFHEVISEKVAACDALLAVIGPGWLSDRLQQEGDFVRIEIAAALQRDVRVVPVLLDGADMPTSDQLPDALKPLARRNAATLSHVRFVEDAGRLADALEKVLGASPAGSSGLSLGTIAGAALSAGPIAAPLVAHSLLKSRGAEADAAANPVDGEVQPQPLDESFKRFECDDQLHVGDIPAPKLMNAIQKCGVPEGEAVLALVDFTVMKNGNDALLVTNTGLRVHHSSGDFDQPQFIPNADLASHQIEKHGWWQIRLGGTRITASGGPDRQIVIDFLNAIRAGLL
ncbi:MAG: toll/interleukin-1 receptor domain-containing protein [Pseudomonadota bacterium]